MNVNVQNHIENSLMAIYDEGDISKLPVIIIGITPEHLVRQMLTAQLLRSLGGSLMKVKIDFFRRGVI